jgi:hypothetical protein
MNKIIDHSNDMLDGMMDDGIPELVVLAVMAPFVLLLMLTFIMILVVQYIVRYIYIVLPVVVIGYTILAILAIV